MVLFGGPNLIPLLFSRDKTSKNETISVSLNLSIYLLFCRTMDLLNTYICISHILHLTRNPSRKGKRTFSTIFLFFRVKKYPLYISYSYRQFRCFGFETSGQQLDICTGVSHKRRPIAKTLKVDILHYFTFLIITE